MSKDLPLKRTPILVKLTFLMGACRMKNINKKQLEKSIQDFLNRIQAGEFDEK